MSKFVVSIALCVGLLGAGAAATASAAQPVSQGCVGDTVTAAAHAVHPYGSAVSGFAHDTSNGNRAGVGDDLQALQAGQVPDEVFPNTCND
jgi:hypothetical protein